MFRNIPIHLIIFVIVAMAPVVKAIFEKLAKKRQEAQAEALRQKQMEERLRTGRVTEAPPTDGPMSAEAELLAARRRAHIEELRRRGQARASQQGGSVIISIPGSTGPTVPSAPRPRPQARPPQQRPTRSGRPAVPPPIRTTPRQTAPTRPVSPPARQAPRSAVPSGPATSRLPAEAPAARLAYEEPPARRVLAEAPSGPSSKPAAESALDVHTASIADWRRAMIMREVLAPPLALRPDGPD